MTPLTPAQQKAIDFLEGDCLIEAGAGSGKTRVLVEKVARLGELRKTPLEKIAVVTFTEKAAEELHERLSKRLKSSRLPQDRRPTIGTLHALAAHLLRCHGFLGGIAADFQVMDEGLADLEQSRTVREGLLALLERKDPQALALVETYEYGRSVRLVQEFFKVSERASGFASASERGTGGWGPHSPKANGAAIPPLEAVQELKKRYAERKRALNRLDFDDLETVLLELLQNRGARELCQGHFDWIFVDEFQDTSPRQWEILSLLHDPPRNRLVLVGDPRQSIYRFRGADPSLFERVRSEFGGAIFCLDQNFRSASSVIRSINEVCAPLFGPSYRPLETSDRGPDHGGLEILPLPECRAIAERRKREAVQVSEKIQDLVRSGLRWGEIALLFRTRLGIPIFQESFGKVGIPYETASGESLLEKTEILPLILLLRLLVRPDDTVSSYGVKSSPLAPLVAKLEGLRSSATETPALLSNLKEQCLPFYPDPVARTNAVLFFRLLEQLYELGVRGADRLLQDIEALRREGARIRASEALGSPDAVQLLTFHAAKGLEFPIVILCDLGAPFPRRHSMILSTEEGSLLVPARDLSRQGLGRAFQKSEVYQEAEKRAREEDLEEAKRLLYVGMTRAISRIIVPLESGGEPPHGTMAQWLTRYAGSR